MAEIISENKPFRLLPALDETNRHFWTGGKSGELIFLRCQECSYYIHPPSPRCPGCLTKNLAPEAVSGRGIVKTFTIVVHAFNPMVPTPFVLGIVELEEQAGLQLMTNVIGIQPEEVSIGMPVEVVFEDQGEVFVPLFRPRGA